MKQIVKAIFTTALCLCLISSCHLIDFEEGCFYTGDVKVIFDWQHLNTRAEKPDIMQTVFYPDNSVLASYPLSGDTLLTGLAAANHAVLTYNHPQGITFYEMDCPCSAYATLVTYTHDSKVYTTNVPALYAAKKEIAIPAFERTECVLVPRPCFQQVFIDFVIIRRNVDTAIENLTGELSGVATRYSFGDMQAMQSQASLPFKSKEVTADKYSTAMCVLGMCPEVSKNIDIHLSLAGDRDYYQNLDLTGVFENFTAPAIYLTIEVYLSNVGISLSIADWCTGEGGHIDI
ncbi:hypothetical protein [Dysgonomonas sp. 216]|uniref:DUF5119 domain-containing protein n=1 Tax=Dysgonomonas sp. 216 TaxID=2302934 RepID=UPI0013D0D65E|nr:hypothetical protein [Dysgonomonas sp. 216]